MTIQEAKQFILDIYVNDPNNSVLEAYDQITDRYDYLPRTEEERLEYVKNVVLEDTEFINKVIENVQMKKHRLLNVHFTNNSGKIFYVDENPPKNQKVKDLIKTNWDFTLEDIVDEAIEIDEGVVFIKVRDRYYETNMTSEEYFNEIGD